MIYNKGTTMDILETLADDTLQENGKWIEFRDGASFLIAYAERPKARNKLGRISMRARRANRGRDLDTSQADEAWAEAAVGVVLLDWKGVTKGGVDFPFSVDNAKWLLKASAQVRDFIIAESANVNNFQKEGEPEASPLADTKSGT